MSLQTPTRGQINARLPSSSGERGRHMPPPSLAVAAADGCLLAPDAGGGCEELIPESPVRLQVLSNPSLFLTAPEGGAILKVAAGFAGETVGVYLCDLDENTEGSTQGSGG